MTKKKNTALAVKENADVALPEDLSGSWGSEGVDNADILIPRALLMQPLSDFVADKVAAAGDIIKSTTKEVLYTESVDKPFEFIPIMTYKTWRIMVMKDGKYVFHSLEPMTATNVNDPLEWLDGNQQFRRDRTINFYVLLPSEIKKEIVALDKLSGGGIPDTDDCLVPCLLSFTRTSFPAGKELATHFKKAQHFRIPPAVTTFILFSEFEKNDKGNYYVYRVAKSRKTAIEELSMCKRWYDTLQEASVVVDPEAEAEALDDPRANEDMADMNSTF